MEALIRRVRQQLQMANSYTALEIELEGLLPDEKMHREKRTRSIQDFAKENSWSATILDPGIRVTFRNLAV